MRSNPDKPVKISGVRPPSNITLKRTELVAHLLAKGLTIREITDAMASEGVVNPETGKPYGKSTIGHDAQAARAMWRRHIIGAYEHIRPDVVAEILEVKRAAWARIVADENGVMYDRADLKTILDANEQLIKVLGLAEPRRIALEGNQDRPIELKATRSMGTEELRGIVSVFTTQILLLEHEAEQGKTIDVEPNAPKEPGNGDRSQGE